MAPASRYTDRKALPQDEQQALRALTALQVYGRSGGGAAVGTLWPKPLDLAKAGTGEGQYAVDEFAQYAGLAPKQAASALGGLRDKGLLVFVDGAGLGVTAAGTLAGITGTHV